MFEFHRNERLLFSTVLFGFVLLTIIIAVGPAISTQTLNEPLPTSEPLTAEEERGMQVYVDEGCAYCHTQQVRPVTVDEDLGRPAVPGDFARVDRMGVWRQSPALLGSSRNGPDLTNVGKRQPSEQWHLIHLYNPRAVVQESIMPGFPWLFRVVDDPSEDATVVTLPDEFGPDEGKVVATEQAEALVAYLLSLEQPPLPGAEAKPTAEKPEEMSGANLFAANCASCHQEDGTGVTGTFPPLVGNSVVVSEDPKSHVETILEGLQGKTIDGVAYSAAMPGFADSLSDAEIAAIVNHERTSWGNSAPTIEPEQVAEIRQALEEAEGEGESGGSQ